MELIQDPELYRLFEAGIRGGMTFINKHHVEADESTQMSYLDVNNLYGWALSQKLPVGEFRWLEDHTEMNGIVERCANGDEFDGDRGYVLEVDIVIPDSIQDKLDDLPIAPELCYPPGSKVEKLLLTHEPKKNYVVNGRVLTEWLSYGAKVTKVNRAVEFKQVAIFKGYIDYNTKMRAASTDSFQRDYYKLKNNSLYGKTVENLKKRINLRLCSKSKRLITYCSHPMFRRSIKIADDLIAVILNKEIVCLDRPMYIGQTVLDLSKLRMYQFQYKELQNYREKFNCQINIVAGDTDSFFLECKNVDLRLQLYPKMIEDGLLDTSNYPVTDPLFSDKICSVIGKVKDENKGNQYKEWVFLRPKCYSLQGDKNTLKAKGISLTNSNLTHEAYKKVYTDGGTVSIPQKRIGSVNHQLYTFMTEKRALQCLDDKRYWFNSNESYAYGHYKIRQMHIATAPSTNEYKSKQAL